MSIWSRLKALEQRVVNLEYERNVPMTQEGAFGCTTGQYSVRFAVMRLLEDGGYKLRPGSAPTLEKKP